MKIRFEYRDYQCSDGCCFEDWYELYIDDKLIELDYRFGSHEQCYKYILETYFKCNIDDGY